jgi:hypothetical protein
LSWCTFESSHCCATDKLLCYASHYGYTRVPLVRPLPGSLTDTDCFKLNTAKCYLELPIFSSGNRARDLSTEWCITLRDLTSILDCLVYTLCLPLVVDYDADECTAVRHSILRDIPVKDWRLEPVASIRARGTYNLNGTIPQPQGYLPWT